MACGRACCRWAVAGPGRTTDIARGSAETWRGSREWLRQSTPAFRSWSLARPCLVHRHAAHLVDVAVWGRNAPQVTAAGPLSKWRGSPASRAVLSLGHGSDDGKGLFGGPEGADTGLAECALCGTKRRLCVVRRRTRCPHAERAGHQPAARPFDRQSAHVGLSHPQRCPRRL